HAAERWAAVAAAPRPVRPPLDGAGDDPPLLQPAVGLRTIDRDLVPVRRARRRAARLVVQLDLAALEEEVERREQHGVRGSGLPDRARRAYAEREIAQGERRAAGGDPNRVPRQDDSRLGSLLQRGPPA